MNLSKLIRLADDAFRKHLLYHVWDAPYLINCTVCKVSFKPDFIEVGHIIKRSHYIIRWDAKNAVPVCRLCNQTHDNTDEYRNYVDSEILEELWEKSRNSSFRLSQEFVLEKIRAYE